jgi:hypothetical protein
MKAFAVLLTLVVLVLIAHVVAVAGPGDPRLVNGVLEWPRTVTNEPFLVVRGDDGVLYYVGIAAARRDGPLAGGARVSVLGLEGRTANEITALGVGAGETTEAALAHLQGARPAPAASAPVVATPPPAVPVTAPPGAPTPSAAAAPAAAPVATSPAGTGPASPPAPPATTVTPSAPRGAPAPAVAPPAPPVTAPGMTVMPGAAAPSTAALAPAPPAAAARSAAVAAPLAAKRPVVEAIAAPATLPVSAGDDRRWTEISGIVESLVGRTLVLRSEEGRVAVDVSSLSPSLERMVTPGTMVRVYGVPVEMRFKAMGFFDPGGR